MIVAEGRTLGEKVAWTQLGSSGPVRLDAAIAGKLEGMSRSAARVLIQDGRVSVAGRTCRRGSSRLNVGDEVVVDLLAGPVDDQQSTLADHEVVLEDDHLLVVDKPAGVPVHPGRGHRGDTLIEALVATRPRLAAVGDPERPGIVHRLDKDTSGLLVVAKTDATPFKPDRRHQGPSNRADLHGPRRGPDQPGPGRHRGANRSRSGKSNAPGGSIFRQAGEDQVPSGQANVRRIAARGRPGNRSNAPDQGPHGGHRSPGYR